MSAGVVDALREAAAAAGRRRARRVPLPGDAERRDARARRRGRARRRRWPATCTSGSSGSASTSGAAPVAPARHGGCAFASRPRLQPAPPGSANVRSVRCRCLPFTAAARRGAVRGTRIGCARRLIVDREQALDVALGQIERQFGKGSVMKMSDRPQVSVGAVSTGSLDARPRARHRRAAARPRRRDLRAGVVRQDDARLPRDRRGAAPRRHLRLHRRGARDGPGVREADRRRHRQPARLAARHGRAGARDHGAARSAPARSTSSRSTRSPRSTRRRRSRARWATATSASRRG